MHTQNVGTVQLCLRAVQCDEPPALQPEVEVLVPAAVNQRCTMGRSVGVNV